MMRRLFLVTSLALAIAVGGCGPDARKFVPDVIGGVQAVFKAATTTVDNPVQPVNIYQVKTVYVAAEELVAEYWTKCFGGPDPHPVTVRMIQADPALSVLCRRRVSRYEAMKAAGDKSYRTIRAFERFVAENPSGNAASYLSAAWRAVNDFRSKTPG